MSDIIGWDLAYKIYEKDLEKKEDVLTLLIHFLLIKAGYRCIGLGDDKKFSGEEETSEVLPSAWNATNSYAIRYVLNGSLFILLGVPVDDNIVYNFLQVDNLGVTNVSFNINNTVETLRGQIETLFKNKAMDIVIKIRSELLNTGPGKEISTQTTYKRNSADDARRSEGTNTISPIMPRYIPSPDLDLPIRIDPSRSPLGVGRNDLDPFGVGRNDLDPFGVGRNGGGMLFDPFGGPRGVGPNPGAGIPGGLPRGGIPPGARFDPFGPPPTVPPSRPRQPPPDSDDFPSWYM